MGYLGRLKALETQSCPWPEPSKPSKAGFEGFEGAPQWRDLESFSPDDGDKAERAAIVEFDGGIPREWAEALAGLECSPPPGVAAVTWRPMIDRAARFCDAWAGKAAACGWSAADLFGLDHAAPPARFAGIGAGFLGIAGAVVEVTPDALVIRLPNGVRQRVTKRPDHQPPAWTLTT